MSKFHVDHTCFHRGEESANFSVRVKYEERIEHDRVSALYTVLAPLTAVSEPMTLSINSAEHGVSVGDESTDLAMFRLRNLR